MLRERCAAGWTTSILSAAVVAIAAAGCGSAPDRTKITAAVIAGINGTATQQCSSATTSRFVTQLYGSRGRCRTARAEGGQDGETKVSVTDVEQHGSRAVVTVRLDGGDFAGAGGHVTSLRDRAGAWRVDELGVDFLHSLLTDPDRTSDPQDRRSFACARDATRDLSDSSFRRLAYALLSGRRVPAAVSTCFPPRTGNLH